MRTIEPTATAMLPARAFLARAWAGGWLILGEHGEVTLVDRTLRTLAALDAGAGSRDVAADPPGAVVFVAGPRGLRAIAAASGETAWETSGDLLACHATRDGHLWTAAARGGAIELAVRDPASGAVVRALELADPFGGSAVTLHAHPWRGTVIAWVAAGQDGQAAFAITDDGAALTAAELPPRDGSPPVFTAAGDSYLVAGAGVLAHRAWPSGVVLGSLPWPHDDDDPDGPDVQSLPAGRATWMSTCGRVYVIDLPAMSVVDELVLAGHPVTTVEALHPSLRGDRTPATDLEYAEPGPGGLILTVHARRQLVASQVADWSG